MNVYCKMLLVTAFLCLSAVSALAEDAPDASHVEEMPLEEMYLSSNSVALTEKEYSALKIAEAWQCGEVMTRNPVVGLDGSIEFLFGAEQPSIVCAVMQITDIELQPGENVTGVNLGDSVRWIVQPAVSAGDVTHIIVRPRDVGLETSMVVTTDKRTYHLRLRSHRYEYMPRVKFSYIEDSLEKWERIKTDSAAKRKADTIPETNEYLGELDFQYVISGKTSWKPVRVYNDGSKTIIEMPKSITQKDAPSLLVLRKGDRFWRKDVENIVNYRIQNNRYIVDAVFEKAALVVGVKGNREEVFITYKPQKRGK